MGLRGVGKTVLLGRIRNSAEQLGAPTVWIEVEDSRSLPAMLAPPLRSSLLGLSRRESAADAARRALRGLASFANALKVRYEDIEIGLELAPEPGFADSGNLIDDLPDLLESVGEAARQANTCLAIFLDEIQAVEEGELRALIVALHRVSQRRLPIIVFAAGLPQATGIFGRTVSYSERLFEFLQIGQLSRDHARVAISKPLGDAGVQIENGALAEIVSRTERYPYFLQEWGKHAWDTAPASPITAHDVDRATALALERLEAGFFRIRLERVTMAERAYLRAMAEIGPGPHGSGEVARVLGRAVSAIAPTRRSLIAKGMIWSPQRGITAFAVPMFDRFLRRNIAFQD